MNAAAAFTAAQIAEALGCPKSTVIRRAENEGWAFSEETGRGGRRRMYSVEQLPAALRAKLLWSNAPAANTPPEARAAASAGRAEAAKVLLRSTLEGQAAETRRQGSLRQAGELGSKAQQRMDARLAVVRAFEVFAADLDMPMAAARLLFAQRYNTGDVAVSPQVRAELSATSDSSIERWQRDIRTRGISALAGAYGNRAGTGRIDSQPELREFVQAMLVQYPHARATHVMRGLQARFKGHSNLPGIRALARWIDEWRSENKEVVLALENPDLWKSRHMVAFGSYSEDVDGINQKWELDSSPADVMCTDGRCALIAGIDVGTRRARIFVAPTSRSIAVAALLRTMLLVYGAPEKVKTDNGSDYVSDHITRVLVSLDAEQLLCDRFQPQQKPHIERFFGTFTRSLVELLPGYIGHSVAERSAIESRKSFAELLMTRGAVVEVRMSSGELQAFCDQWLDTIYHVEPHEGLGKRSPFEVAAAQASQVRHIGDEHALDILLAEAPGSNGKRTVAKKGIKLDDAWFIAPELEAWVGQVVQVRYDPLHHDLGTVYVFEADGLRFICAAQCPERTGMDRREVAIKAKAMQRERVQAERRALKASAKKLGVDQVVTEILQDRAKAAGKLAVLPVRTTAHTSPGLAAAAKAAQVAQAPQRTTAHIEDLAAVQAARARIAEEDAPKGTPNELADRRGPTPTPVFETVGQRVQWLLGQARTRALSLEEQQSLADYRRAQPAAYRRIADLISEQMGPLKEDAPGRVAGDSGAV